MYFDFWDKNNWESCEKMKVCLVGFGHAGKSYLKAIQKYSRGLQVYVVDIDNRIKNDLPNNVNFSANIPHADMDLAIIATPPSTHLQVYKDLKDSCGTIIVEKPFAVNAREMEEFFDLAEQYKVFFSIHAIYGKELEYPVNASRMNVSAISQLFCDPYGVDAPLNLGGPFWDSAFNALGILNKLIDVKALEVVRVIESNSNRFEMDSILVSEKNEIEYKLTVDWKKEINLKVTEICSQNRTQGLLYNHSQQLISDLDGMQSKYKPLTLPRLVDHYSSVIEDCLNSSSFEINNAFAKKVSNQVWNIIQFDLLRNL